MRIAKGWTEAGLNFRSNLINEEGDVIPLHAHSYDHVALITEGWFAVKQITPEGETLEYQMSNKGYVPRKTIPRFDSAGYRIMIPAWHQHTFRLIERQDRPGEVLCIWPE